MALDINELNKLLEKGSDGKITHLDSVNIGNVKHSLWGLPVTFTVQEEKKKTLSDKIVKSYPSAKDLTHYKDCCYIEDVKQSLKEYISWVDSNMTYPKVNNTINNREAAKKIFGSRLME